MRKCPYCGTQMNDDSLFCTECGKPIPQGNVCPHCGASVNDGDSFCQNCGKKIDGAQSTSPVESTEERCPHCGSPVGKDSVFCENCGKKIDGTQLTPRVESTQEEYPGNDTPFNDGGVYFENCEKEVHNEPSNTSNRQQPQPTNGNLVIRWDGAWSLVDYKIKLNVNGDNIGEYSFKEGFETSVPITSSYTTVVTKLSIFKTKEELILNPNENYTYELVYHKTSGWLGFILYDSIGNELRRDKLHWGMLLLSFLFPIVGVIYAICVWKKKPATSYTAIYISILGVIISLIVTSNLPPLSKFVHLPQNSAIDTDVELTPLTDNLDAKKKEELETKRYEVFKENFTFNNFLALLGNYDNVSFAHKCGLELIYKIIDNDDEITCEEYIYGYDTEKGDIKEFGYEIVAKSNHACYLIYNLDSSTYASMYFKDSSDAENFQEQAKEYGLLVLDGSMYVPKTKMESGYHYVDSLDWGGDYEPVYEISQTERQNGWYRVFIGIDF